MNPDTSLPSEYLEWRNAVHKLGLMVLAYLSPKRAVIVFDAAQGRNVTWTVTPDELHKALSACKSTAAAVGSDRRRVEASPTLARVERRIGELASEVMKGIPTGRAFQEMWEKTSALLHTVSHAVIAEEMEDAVTVKLSPEVSEQLPCWDGSTLIARNKSKSYKQPAATQRAILDAFQAATWQHRIPNPRKHESLRYQLKSEHAARLAQLRKDVDNLNRSLHREGIPIGFVTDGNDHIQWQWGIPQKKKKKIRRS